MAVQNISRRAGPFTGTGLVSSFPFGFKVFLRSDVQVLRAVSDDIDSPEEILRLDDDYAVTLNADQDENPGGTVTLSAPLAVGLRLAILSNIAADQQVVLTNHDGFLPETLNEVHDKAVALIQELKEETARTLKTPATSEKTPEELTQELLSAQEDARVQADAAAQSASEAKASELATAEYAEAAKVIVPYASEIQAVATNIESVVSVGSALEDIGTVASFKTEITNVSTNIGDILIAADMENLDAYRVVAGIRNEVVNVAGISSDVTTVSQIGDSVQNVASNIGSVTTVSGSIGNVNVIAKDIEGGGTLPDGFKGGSIVEAPEETTEITGGVIKTVAENIADIHTAAANIDAIVAAPSNASSASASASSAANSATLASRAEANAAQHQTNAAQSATLSQAWAVQTTAPVEGDLYGAKYYAEKAASTASEVADATQSLIDEGDAQRRSISTAGASAVSNVNAARDEAVAAVGTAESSAVSSVSTAQTNAVSAVGTAKTSAVSSVNSAKSTALTEIGSAASTKKSELETIAGMYYTPAVTADGVLSWTNNGGKENPDAVNIKGPKGDTGLGFVIKAQYADYDTFIAAHPTGSEGDNYQMADTGEIWIWDVEALAWKNIGKMRGSSANEVPMETDPTTYYETLFSGFGGLVASAEA